jgi:DmsE family decaheme c-type cytochrome
VRAKASVILILPILAGGLARAGSLPEGYVGSTVCKGCHSDLFFSFYKNPHFRSLAEKDRPAEDTGCEGCHGPGKPHVLAAGGKATIVAFSQLGPEKILDNCLRCHANTLSRANIQRSEHTESDVVCTNCHSIHKPSNLKTLLAKPQTVLCESCHPAVRAQFDMPLKHRVHEGFMSCTDCHNPHGTNAPTWRMGVRPKLVGQALGGEEPCLKCHQDKRGPFAFEHPAIRVDGCESCHVPHGSTNPRLLKRPVVLTLCLECHNGLNDFGRDGNGIFVPAGVHNLADPRYRNCTTCHVRIHGSNASQDFLR